jgi:hypothetical protein
LKIVERIHKREEEGYSVLDPPLPPNVEIMSDSTYYDQQRPLTSEASTNKLFQRSLDPILKLLSFHFYLFENC